MPIIQVNMLEGRTVEQKRNLHAAIMRAAVNALGVAPESVRVLIHEMHPENFAVSGRTAGEIPLAARRQAAGTGASHAAEPAMQEASVAGT